MPNRALLLIILYFISYGVFAQTNIDSLLNRYPTEQNDSIKVLIGIQLLEQQKIPKEELKDLEKISWQSSNIYLIASVQVAKGKSFEQRYEYDSALKWYDSAEILFKEGNYDQKTALTKYEKTKIYYTLDQKVKVTETGYEALAIFRKIGDSMGEAKMLNGIGNANNYWGFHDVATQYYQEALDIYNRVDDKRGQAVIHYNMAGMYAEDELYEEAENTYQKTLEIVKVLGDEEFEADTYLNFALIFTDSDIDHAEALVLKGFAVHKKNDYQQGMAFAYQHLCNIYSLKRDFAKSDEFCAKALTLGMEIQYMQIVINVHDYLYDRYQKQGLFERALNHYVQSTELSDSLLDSERTRNIQELNTKYESDKKKSENELLKKEAQVRQANIERQQQIILFVLIGALVLIGFTVFLVRARIIRSKLIKNLNHQKQIAEKDKQTIEQQSEKLKELDAAKSRFFANISHDLRTPLTLIQGSFENIQSCKESYLTQAVEDQVKTGLKNSEQLLHLVNEINDLNLLEEGRLKLNRQSVDIGQFLGLAVGMFESAAEIKSIRLDFLNLVDASVFVNTDPNHLERIIYNLMSNALKFTESGGNITVELTSKSQQAVIRVSDTGKGIDAKSLPYIFDRFYQSILNEYNTNKEGMGIGLSLVKELVQLYDGQAEVASELGKGSTFTITLPMIEPAAEPAQFELQLSYQNDLFIPTQDRTMSIIQTDFETSKVNKRYTVLIVEDHVDILDYIRSTINDQYHTKTAPNGQVALKILEKMKIDLVVSDLMMPWMDGFELLEAMRDDEHFRDIPVMIVSARTSEQDKARILALGVNDYLIKPFKQRELLSRIENLIARKSIQKSPLITDIGLLPDIEKNLLASVEKLIIKNISNSRLSVLDLADEMMASERQVYRLIKNLSGMTPYEYIKEVRLQFVKLLLKQKAVRSVAEASSKIGMKNSTAFKKQFMKRFQKDPAEFLN